MSTFYDSVRIQQELYRASQHAISAALAVQQDIFDRQMAVLSQVQTPFYAIVEEIQNALSGIYQALNSIRDESDAVAESYKRCIRSLNEASAIAREAASVQVSLVRMPSDELIESIRYAAAMSIEVGEDIEELSVERRPILSQLVNASKEFIKDHLLEIFGLFLTVYFGIMQSMPNDQLDQLIKLQEAENVSRERTNELLEERNNLLEESNVLAQQNIEVLRDLHLVITDIGEYIAEDAQFDCQEDTTDTQNQYRD